MSISLILYLADFECIYWFLLAKVVLSCHILLYPPVQSISKAKVYAHWQVLIYFGCLERSHDNYSELWSWKKGVSWVLLMDLLLQSTQTKHLKYNIVELLFCFCCSCVIENKSMAGSYFRQNAPQCSASDQCSSACRALFLSPVYMKQDLYFFKDWELNNNASYNEATIVNTM